MTIDSSISLLTAKNLTISETKKYVYFDIAVSIYNNLCTIFKYFIFIVIIKFAQYFFRQAKHIFTAMSVHH